MKTLCDAKVMLPTDVKCLDERLLVFPMKLANLEAIISTHRLNDSAGKSKSQTRAVAVRR
jgi:hypothetical protein